MIIINNDEQNDCHTKIDRIKEPLTLYDQVLVGIRQSWTVVCPPPLVDHNNRSFIGIAMNCLLLFTFKRLLDHQSGPFPLKLFTWIAKVKLEFEAQCFRYLPSFYFYFHFPLLQMRRWPANATLRDSKI